MLDLEKEVLEGTNSKTTKHYSIDIDFVFDDDYGFDAFPLNASYSSNSASYHFEDVDFENFKAIVSRDLKTFRDHLHSKNICKNEIMEFLQDIDFNKPCSRYVDGNYSGTKLDYNISIEYKYDHRNMTEGTFILQDKYIPIVKEICEKANTIFNHDDTTKMICSKIFLAGVLTLKEKYLDSAN